MDKNGARGRAHSIASAVLRGIAKEGGLLDEVATDVTPEELAKVKRVLIILADEHELYAQTHRKAGATDAPEWEDEDEQ